MGGRGLGGLGVDGVVGMLISVVGFEFGDGIC